jgi:hypothetical protein
VSDLSVVIAGADGHYGSSTTQEQVVDKCVGGTLLPLLSFFLV